MPEIIIPEVLWAQRSNKTNAEKNIIYLTISAPDVTPESLKIDLNSTSLTFSGHSDLRDRSYNVSIEFFKEIDKSESKINHTPKSIQFVLRKKEMMEEYWPRLTKESKKLHFLRTDFDQWIDEDEQDGVPEEDFGNMGGMGGMGGMPGMGDMMGGAGGDFGGLDFSKLGGQMGEDELDDEDEDEEMPSLEDAEESGKEKLVAEPTETAETSSQSKIQEVS